MEYIHVNKPYQNEQDCQKDNDRWLTSRYITIEANETILQQQVLDLCFFIETCR